MNKYTKIKLGLVDPNAKNNSNLSMDDIQSFSKLEDLKEDNLLAKDYATLENNYFVLNGEKTLLKNDSSSLQKSQETGICSTEMSDENGVFSSYPSIEINFSENAFLGGLTLYFGKYDYCNNLDIIFYKDNVELDNINVKPDNTEFFCGNPSKTFETNKIIITFKSTNNPYRYLKLTKINYGNELTFTKDDIFSCNVIEEVDLLSNEISVNTCDFEIYSEDDSFNILNPKGLYSNLKQSQPIEVYQVTGGIEELQGKFYLQKWESQNNNISKFEGIDLIGVIENITYTNPDTTNDFELGYLNAYWFIKRIMDFIGFEIGKDYNITYDENTKGLNGLIFVDNCKNILQKGLFTFGLIADTSRSTSINIYPLKNEGEPKYIDNTRIFDSGSKVTKISNYNKFTINGYGYDDSSNNNKTYSELYKNDDLTIGSIIELTFNNPQEYGNIFYNSAGIPVGVGSFSNTILSINPMHIKYEYKDSSVGPLLLGRDMQENKEAFVFNSPDIKPGDQINALSVDNCELIHKGNSNSYYVSNDIAQRLYEYYKDLYEYEFELIIEDEKVGDYIKIDTEFNQQLIGNLTSLDIDLISGIAKAKMVGRLYINES